VASLAGGLPHVIENVSEVMAIRATASGFHLVSASTLGATLLNVDALGATKTIGTYPCSRPRQQPRSQALTADDTLWVLGVLSNIATIYRLTVTNQQATVYTSQASDYLELTRGELITGP